MKTKTSTRQRAEARKRRKIEKEMEYEFGSVLRDDYILDEMALVECLMEEEM